MPEIVTLDEAKSYCRIDGNTDDAALAIMVAAATDAVTEQAERWDTLAPAPSRLKLAVLARVAESYDNRERTPEARNEPRLIAPFRMLDL